MPERKALNWFWPPVTDTQTAREASRQGLWAATWIAGVTIVFALLAALGYRSAEFDSAALWDAGLFIIIGWGINKSSRVAAVAGLLLYLIERAYMWATVGPKSPGMAILFTLMFINSVRGTFAFHRLSRTQATPGVTPGATA